MQKIMISAIICTYNRERYICKVLQSLLDSGRGCDYEVIAVDNNSTDSSAALIKDFAASHPDFPLRYVQESRQGLSYARNRGIAEAKGDYLLFLDDDAICGEGFLQKLQHRLYSSDADKIEAWGGKIEPLFEDGPAPKWLCRWSRSWVSALDMGKEEKLFKGKAYPIGANMGFSRRCLQDCGQFNCELGRSAGNLMGAEEKDLFLRLKAKGYNIHYLPDCKVEHVIPQSRCSRDYVRRFARGVGLSERLRCKGNGTYHRRLFAEGVKWAGTLVLFFGYLIVLRPVCAATLVLFRAGVTRSLISGK